MIGFKDSIKFTQWIFLLALLPFSAPLLAQQPAEQPAPQVTAAPQITLDQILLRLLQIYAEFRATVPSLVVDEHIVANMSDAGAAIGLGDKSMNLTGLVSGNNLWAGQPHNGNYLYASLVHLERSGTSIRSQLSESREIKTIDGKTAEKNATLSGPAVLDGAISSAQSYILPQFKKCYDYNLATSKRVQHIDALVIEYATKSSLPANAPCPVQEQIKGRAYVDPASMQLIRIEQERPKHKLPGLTLEWKWSIDYAQAMIDGKPFWLPKTIESTAVSEPDEQHTWRFDTSYSNFRHEDATVTPSPVNTAQPR